MGGRYIGLFEQNVANCPREHYRRESDANHPFSLWGSTVESAHERTEVGTNGSYGILHNEQGLYTFQTTDMYPKGWGYALAKEAFDNRDTALDVGDTSTRVRYCEYRDGDEGGLAEMQALEQMVAENAPLRDMLRKERFHYCFHRPRAADTEVTAENIRLPPHCSPSFLALSQMDEVYEAIHAWPMYWYTWVTSPHNLFVASNERPEYGAPRAGGDVAVWDLESQEGVAELTQLLEDRGSFEKEVYRRLGE